mmetsp:Transcript_57729/g.182889  ORF Transcript_57729/g.182889 Transcript_57729/m.182889 type:complete len:222 (-) Transcript_57729:188-853(-)
MRLENSSSAAASAVGRTPPRRVGVRGEKGVSSAPPSSDKAARAVGAVGRESRLSVVGSLRVDVAGSSPPSNAARACGNQPPSPSLPYTYPPPTRRASAAGTWKARSAQRPTGPSEGGTPTSLLRRLRESRDRRAGATTLIIMPLAVLAVFASGASMPHADLGGWTKPMLSASLVPLCCFRALDCEAGGSSGSERDRRARVDLAGSTRPCPGLLAEQRTQHS